MNHWNDWDHAKQKTVKHWKDWDHAKQNTIKPNVGIGDDIIDSLGEARVSEGNEPKI